MTSVSDLWMLRLASRISSGVGRLAGGYPISTGVLSMAVSRQSDMRGVGLAVGISAGSRKTYATRDCSRWRRWGSVLSNAWRGQPRPPASGREELKAERRSITPDLHGSYFRWRLEAFVQGMREVGSSSRVGCAARGKAYRTVGWTRRHVTP